MRVGKWTTSIGPLDCPSWVASIIAAFRHHLIVAMQMPIPRLFYQSQPGNNLLAIFVILNKARMENWPFIIFLKSHLHMLLEYPAPNGLCCFSRLFQNTTRSWGRRMMQAVRNLLSSSMCLTANSQSWRHHSLQVPISSILQYKWEVNDYRAGFLPVDVLLQPSLLMIHKVLPW